jgi:IclR family transcriptional regulator, KDG regulon repressor
MERSKTEGFYNKSLERALRILVGFNSERTTMTLAEVADIVRFPKPTILRLCATLIQYGFLRFDSLTKKYSPGIKFFEIGGIVFSSFSLNEVASVYMRDLQATLRETVFLDILESDRILHINVSEDPSNAIRIRLQIGRRRPPQYGGPGLVLMASLPEGEVDRLLERFPLVPLTAKTITDKRLFKERLEIVRSRGYATEDGEVMDFVGNVSAPVRDYTGKVIAALGVSYVSHSKDNGGLDLIKTATVRTALAISQSMGYVNRTTE